MKIDNKTSLFSSLLVCGALLGAGACNSSSPSNDGRAGQGGEGPAGSGGSADGDDDGLGGSGLGGETATGGSGGNQKPPTCFEAPDSLSYWWPQGGADLQLDYVMRDVVQGKDATINANAGYATMDGFVGQAVGFGPLVLVFANSPTLDDGGEGEGDGNPWPTTSVEFWLNSQLDDAPVLSFFSWSFTLEEGKPVLTYEKTDSDNEGPDVSATYRLESDAVVSMLSVGGVKTFHHIAVVHDVENLEARLYVDGELSATLDLEGPINKPSLDEKRAVFSKILENGSKSAMELGGEGDGDGPWFSGYIDELSLYSGALSAAEIEGIFEAGSLGKCALE